MDQAIPGGRVPAPATAGAHRSETRWFVLDVVPGSGAHSDTTFGGDSEPQSSPSTPTP